MGLFSRLTGRLSARRSPQPERLPSPDELALLTRPNGEPEALMLRELLDEHGVHALIKNRDAASAQAGGLGPPWAYEMWVRRKDLRRARQIIGLAE